MIENSKITINLDFCIKCEACVNECKYYYIDSDGLHLTDDMEDFCIECGKCAAVCPVEAISLKIQEGQKLVKNPPNENLPTFESLINLFQVRRSRRQFKNDSVSMDIIKKILNIAGRYSATGHNQGNVYFTIIQNRDLLKKMSYECTKQVKNLIEKYEDPNGKDSLNSVIPNSLMKKVEDLIPALKQKLIGGWEGKDIWQLDNDLIILHSPKDSLTLVENCSLAAGQIMLSAETLGLGTCSLGYITSFLNIFRSFAKLAKIPIKHKVGYTISIGYPKAKYLRIPFRKPLKITWL